jgi:tryptophan 2,3-dioxygenase
MSDDADPALEPGVKTDFAGQLTYGRYLALDQLLDCQRPVSESHDELLFIVIHQATELWLKLMVHELRGARRRIIADDLQPAFKMLARVSRIQAQLIQSWDVLSTLTPADYLAFRDRLGPASGLQSHQYRLLEFVLGQKQPAMLAVHRHTPAIEAELRRELEAPSLYDETIRLLGRRGFAIAATASARDWTQTHRGDASVLAAWQAIYRDPRAHWDLYELAEELVDLEDWFRQWRFRHVTTVERIIGHKTGTGGSAGVSYLKRALDVCCFPELWQIRTEL